MPANLKVSVIVPAFNAQDTLADCLAAIFSSDYKDFEVIVVDDCSRDATRSIAEEFPVTLVRHDKNQGAAVSRNAGAQKANNDILLFVDADVFIRKDTLTQICGFFGLPEHKDIAAIACAMSDNYCSQTFGAKFVTLRTAYYYRWEKTELSRDYSIFQSQCGAIRRDVFRLLKGFDPRFKGVGMEEYEFGHRIMQSHKNVILRNIQFDRKCKSFPVRLKALLTRSSTWAPLFLRRIKFESRGAVATRQEGLSAIFSFLGACGLLFSLWQHICLAPSLLFLLIQLFLEMGFLRYAYSREGLLFMLRSYLAIHLMHLAIGIGFIRGVLRMAFEPKKAYLANP